MAILCQNWLNFAILLSVQVFGDGVVAQTVLSRGANGSSLSINWAWAMGVVMGIYFAGGISGEQNNIQQREKLP